MVPGFTNIATHPQGEDTHHVSRRGFVAGALATAVGLPLLNACAPATPSSTASGGQPAATGAGGAVADMTFWDGIRDVILSRRPMADYDQLVSEWKTAAGDQVRKEYTDAMAAAK